MMHGSDVWSESTCFTRVLAGVPATSWLPAVFSGGLTGSYFGYPLGQVAEDV